MLNAIRIENFKLFRDLELPLHPLTVLTGFNSSGKSTVIQAFLLSDLACRSSTVSLNGPYGLALGEAFDVLNLGAPDAEIRFTLTGDGEDVSIRLPVSEDRAVSLSAHDPSETGDLQSFNIGIGAYLSAERLGPRDLLEVPSALEGSSYLGERGQFTAHVLAQRARVRVIPELLHPKSAESESLVAVTLASQVEAWLSDVVRPVRVQATWLPSTSAAMIRFRDVPSLSDASTESFDGELPADWMRPSNVGFGLSYALPVIVGGLTVERDKLFIVENPEAHLHPAGQSRIGYFLALVAASGVQTIVETHSEHVVNGIRLAAGRDRVIDPDSAIFHFFDDPRPTTMSISSTGALSDWPRGFFDQMEEDLSVLSRIRRQ